MKELENKLIDLILRKCLNFNQASLLHIHVDLKEHLCFAQKIKAKAEKMGITVSIDVVDRYELHDYLKDTTLEDIELNPLLDRSSWDETAKKGGAILFLNSNVPGLMADVESEKMVKINKIVEQTCTYYRKNVTAYLFPWCIVAIPNEAWAKTVFPNEPDAYQKLYLKIMEMCMVTTPDPLKSWDEWIVKNNYFKEELNKLQITRLHYKNGLGTDLCVQKRADARWLNLDKKDAAGGKMIANMPSYEIFTSPDYRYTEGIVYSSKPLIYEGKIIDHFWIRFHEGKAIEFDAQTGRDALESLLKDYKNSCYLGEIALVEHDSPISKTGLVFNTTLFDENASCHLALGKAYQLPVDGASSMSDEELKEIGLNVSPVHVDFMIGTHDLQIEADTNMGRKLIFKNGKFNI